MAVGIVLGWLVLDGLLTISGVHLGRAWGNPSAGLWLPLLAGPLGFIIFVTGSHPATQPARLRQAAAITDPAAPAG